MTSGGLGQGAPEGLVRQVLRRSAEGEPPDRIEEERAYIIDT